MFDLGCKSNAAKRRTCGRSDDFQVCRGDVGELMTRSMRQGEFKSSQELAGGRSRHDDVRRSATRVAELDYHGVTQGGVDERDTYIELGVVTDFAYRSSSCRYHIGR